MRDPRRDQTFQVRLTFEVECFVNIEARNDDEALRFAQEEDLPPPDQWEPVGEVRAFIESGSTENPHSEDYADDRD